MCQLLLKITYRVLTIVLTICLQSCGKQDQSISKKNDSIPAVNYQQPLDFDYPKDQPDPLPEADTLYDTQYTDSLFLRNGELWAANYILKTERILTKTNSQIDTFFVSPSRKYAACLRRVGLIDSPGLYEEGEVIPKDPVHEVLVLNLVTKQIIRQFAEPEDIFIHIDRWISKSRLVFWCTNGLAANATYVYDAYRDSIQKVQYGYPNP